VQGACLLQMLDETASYDSFEELGLVQETY